MIARLFVPFFLVLSSLSVCGQKFNGLARTPPMGWNSWNKFGCHVDENLIRSAADAMVSSGLKDAGYQYIVIDDCWHGERDSLGFIHPDPVRFPSGMKALADYIHSKELKFGIYSDAGWKTCGGRPGSRGHEYQDAMTYASWGVDYLKYDWCETEGLNAEGAYLTMRNALYAAGRPIVFSLCEWGNNKPWMWGAKIGHLWRTTGDIAACFDCEVNHGTWSSWGVMKILDMQDGLRAFAGPDHWNDPDMMEVGNGMTPGEDRAHFYMWCMLGAPLFCGNDLSTMSTNTKALLTNKAAIAINQDSLGIQGFKYEAKDSVETWFKPLAGGDWAVCFLNRSKKEAVVEFDWAGHSVKDELNGLQVQSGSYRLLDVTQHKVTGTTGKPLRLMVAGHDAVMFRMTPAPQPGKKR